MFYDLVYVVLIARVTQAPHEAITPRTGGTFLVLFGLLWIRLVQRHPAP